MSKTGAPDSRLSARLGLWLAAGSAAVFGFGTTFAVYAYEGGSNPLTVVLVRTGAFVIVVGIILASLGRVGRLRRRALADTLWMAATLAAVALGYQGSVAFIPVGLAALIFYNFPILVGLIAVAAGRDRMTAGKAAALLAALIGLALALSPGMGVLDWRGIALALIAALGMALTMVFGGDATRDEDALLMSLYTNAWMFAALAILTAFTGSFDLPETRIGGLAVAGVCLTYVVAYVCWYLALALVKPVRLAILFNIEPVVTVLVAWLILGERLTALQLLGAALVLASVLSVSLSARRDEGRQPATAGLRSAATTLRKSRSHALREDNHGRSDNRRHL